MENEKPSPGVSSLAADRIGPTARITNSLYTARRPSMFFAPPGTRAVGIALFVQLTCISPSLTLN